MYTRHYGDKNKCPICQSREMKAEYSENKIGLYKKHICKEMVGHNHIRILSNFTNIKNNFIFLENNNNNDLQIKRELSPNNNYIYYIKNQFLSKTLKNRFKRNHHNFEIIDFPVLNSYFNS